MKRFKFVKEPWTAVVREWNVWSHFAGTITISMAFAAILALFNIPNPVLLGALLGVVFGLVLEVRDGWISAYDPGTCPGFSVKDALVNGSGGMAFYFMSYYINGGQNSWGAISLLAMVLLVVMCIYSNYLLSTMLRATSRAAAAFGVMQGVASREGAKPCIIPTETKKPSGPAPDAEKSTPIKK